ncbi:MAG: YbjN domain-containing protein [Saprospiraceae bacterium]|nr:YbjN domain-containing protein [Saprospiraceae bacterium]
MTTLTKDIAPSPCLLSTTYTSGWAWRIHQRLYLMPSALLDGVSEAVLEFNGQRRRADLVLFLPNQGFGMAWCREDLDVEIVRIPEHQVGKACRYCTAYGVDPQWIESDSERINSMPYWGFDETGHLISFHPAGTLLEQGTKLGSWLTPDLLAAWDHGEMVDLWQCIPCGIVTATSERSSSCGACGQSMKLIKPDQFEEHAPVFTMENVIRAMGYDPVLTRNGPRAWLLRQGSAEMHLRYAQDEASLCADVMLVRVGDLTRKKELYQYLLQENPKLETFGFSIQNDRVMISLLISARSIKEKETAALFLDLLKKSDDYDNYLVSVFGAEWL